MAGARRSPAEPDLGAEAARFLRWAESDRWHGQAARGSPSHTIFDQLDRDGDGVLTRAEFNALGGGAAGAGVGFSGSPVTSPTRLGSPLRSSPPGPGSPRPLSDIYSGAPYASAASSAPRSPLEGGFHQNNPPRVGLGPSYGDVERDPWKALLDASDGEFVSVPAETLKRLRRIGEAQLVEIESLRSELANEPALRADIAYLEAQLSELESASVLASNEAELRRHEADGLDAEAARLRLQLAALEKRRDALRSEVELMESWLPDSVVQPLRP